MQKEDFELIEEEFKAMQKTDMKPVVLTESLINELFDNYNTTEFVEIYYDCPVYCKENGVIKKDEFARKCDVTWLEPFEKGIWGMTMKQVRQEARKRLMDRIIISSKEPRFYIRRTGACVELYYYSRDEEQMDMWHKFLIDREVIYYEQKG